MPKHPHLTRIGAIWYFRAKVPLDLIDAYGGKTEVKRSLRTRDPQEALRLVRIASGEFEKDNEAHRARKQGQTTPLTDAQLSGLALEWLEEAARRDILSDIQNGPLDQFEAEEVIENLREVWGVEAEQLKRGYFYDISRDVDAFLEKRRIILDKQQDPYWVLCRLILRASIEQTRRKISRLEGDPNPRPFDELFKGVVDPHSTAATTSFVPIAASPSPISASKPEGRTLRYPTRA